MIIPFRYSILCDGCQAPFRSMATGEIVQFYSEQEARETASRLRWGFVPGAMGRGTVGAFCPACVKRRQAAEALPNG